MKNVKSFGNFSMYGEKDDVAKLFKKFNNVMKEVDMIPKNGYNRKDDYYYARAEDIKNSLRTILADNRIFLSSTIEEIDEEKLQIRNKEYVRAKIKIRFGFHCIDTTAAIFVIYYGSGVDSWDKYLYKAYTGAIKYCLSNNLVLSTGTEEDPEKYSDEYKDEKSSSKTEHYENNKNNNTKNII